MLLVPTMSGSGAGRVGLDGPKRRVLDDGWSNLKMDVSEAAVILGELLFSRDLGDDASGLLFERKQ